MFSLTKKNLKTGDMAQGLPAASPKFAFIWSRNFGYAALIGLFFYAIGEASGPQSFIDILGMVLALAFASFAAGGAVGFLFGIPHTTQPAPPANTAPLTGTPPVATNPAPGPPATGATTSPQAPASVVATPRSNAVDFKPSTNLEQIADWLTKIIVGVGLTSIHRIIPQFNGLCISIGGSLDHKTVPGGHGAPVVGTILVLFSILGFLIVYLWTYLYLIGIQRSLACDIIDTISGQIKETDRSDKEAIDLANTQLNLPEGATDLSVDDLANVFMKASDNVISSIFFKTVSTRKTHWKTEERFRVDRTVPIFKALIKMDTKFEYPGNYAELAYALKEMTKPDFAEALKTLDKAIEGFQAGNQVMNKGKLFFNRAYCKIRLDNNYTLNQPSTPENRASIQADLDIAEKDRTVAAKISADTDIINWKRLNPANGIVN